MHTRRWDRRFSLLVMIAAGAGCTSSGSQRVDRTGSRIDANELPEARSDDVPEHLRRVPALYVREGANIVEAPADDQAIARRYPTWPDKGRPVGGVRLTLLCASSHVRTGDEVRVVHVLEAMEPGISVYVMGPKEIFGEYVDGSLATRLPETPDYPWLGEYDGAVVDSPAADYNYEITSYRFSASGAHRIQWRLGQLESNVLEVTVTDRPG
jgi:hypothetical protein